MPAELGVQVAVYCLAADCSSTPGKGRSAEASSDSDSSVNIDQWLCRPFVTGSLLSGKSRVACFAVALSRVVF